MLYSGEDRTKKTGYVLEDVTKWWEIWQTWGLNNVLGMYNLKGKDWGRHGFPVLPSYFGAEAADFLPVLQGTELGPAGTGGR